MQKLTDRQISFAHHYAVTGDRRYAVEKAGLKGKWEVEAARLRRDPRVLAEIAAEQETRLFSEALPAAVACLVEIITNKSAAAGARVQAAKVVFDRTFGKGEDGREKQPHEMTGEELAAAIGRLEEQAAAKAKPIVIEPASKADLFD